MSGFSSQRGKSIASGLLLGVASFALVATASAQEAVTDTSTGGIQDIVVTAQRRSEDLQKVPIAITALTSETLEATGLTSTLALTQAVPSITFTRSGPSILFAIRGVGNTSAGSGEEGPNAFYVDNVYIADLTSLIVEFNNIDRVEVLKGPQGTLFGRNASGGLINIITREPGSEFVFDAKAGYANYQTVSGQAYVAAPLTDTLSADLALTGKKQSKGWGTNLFDGKETALGWNWGARSKWAWRPSDAFKLVVAGEYFEADDNLSTGFSVLPGSVGIGGFTNPGAYNTNTPDPNYTHRRVWGVSATADLDLDWATLSNITAVRKLKSGGALEGDYVPTPLLRLGIFTKSDTIQQEIRLASKSTYPFSWQVGLFYLRINTALDDNTFRGTQVGGVNSGYNLDSRMVANSYAAFGELTYAITPTTFLTGGLRYTEEKRTLAASQVPINQVPGSVLESALRLVDLRDQLKFKKITYRAALRQDITDDVSAYASYNTGFKAGLWAMQSPRNAPVKPQNTEAFEIGLKTKLFDNMVRFNLAAFHTNIKDFQVRSASAGALSLLLNAGAARINGIEADFEVAPAQGLNLSASVAMLDTKFTDFQKALFTYPTPAACVPNGNPPGAPTGPATGGNTTCIGTATGNRLPLAAKFAGNIGGSYEIPLAGGESSLTFNARYSYTGGFYFEPDNRNKQKAYGLVNGSIKYRMNPNWALELWGNNLTGKHYLQSGVGTPTADQGILGPPRTYGVNLDIDF